MRRISVGDIMTRNIIFAGPTASVHECAKLMIRENLDSLLIIHSRRLLGILTSKDILRLITKKPESDLKKVMALAIAERKLAVIKPSADIDQALTKMKSLGFRRLPVLSRGEIIGVVTLKDILAVEPGIYTEVKGLLDDIREEERKVQESGVEWPLEGICENCGAFSELLKVEGQLLCPDCRDEIH